MRLWHYEILQFLPNSQLLAQKKECDLIWKDIALGRKTNHILINYIWEYDNYLAELSIYYWLLKEEFDKRGFNFKFSDNFITKNVYFGCRTPFSNHHTYRYLLQCFYNLQEKHDRGQKDFTEKVYELLYDYVSKYKKCKKF